MKEAISNKVKLPSVALLVLTILLAILFFLPYSSTKGEYRETLEKYSDVKFEEGLDMNNGDIKDMSLFEYVRVYKHIVDTDARGKDVSLVSMIMIIILAVFVLISMIFSIFKKPIGVIIFDVLGIVMFYIIGWDFKDRGVIGAGKYDGGLVYYIYYILATLVIVSAIWLIIEKRKVKKLDVQNNITE